MAGVTNRGKKLMLSSALAASGTPSSFYVALCTSADTPDAETNVLSDLTEIATGNGYTANGFALTRNTTDFDVNAEDDGSNYGYIQVKDVVWTGDGGNLPATGDGARWAVLIDDSSNVWCYWDLSSDRTVSDTQTLTLQNCEVRLTEPA